MASEPIIAAQFAINLKRCRNDADFSQEDVGVRASLHRTEVSQLERGLRVARIDTLVKLAGALEVPPTVLLEGIAWTPGETVYGSFDVRQSDPELPPELPRGRKPASGADQDQRIG
jgi:transcriptional regulator with XRE-family HTH domain